MAFLDVDAVLLDPDFLDSFDVQRRMETVDITGMSTLSSTTIPMVFGVITPITPNALDRQDGYQVMGRTITVVTKFRLRGEVSGEQPDIVVWRGNNYVVKAINLYPQFGAGFIEAECTSMDRVDSAIEPAQPGAANFGSSVNSDFVEIV